MLGKYLSVRQPCTAAMLLRRPRLLMYQPLETVQAFAETRFHLRHGLDLVLYCSLYVPVAVPILAYLIPSHLYCV